MGLTPIGLLPALFASAANPIANKFAWLVAVESCSQLITHAHFIANAGGGLKQM